MASNERNEEASREVICHTQLLSFDELFNATIKIKFRDVVENKEIKISHF